MESIYKTKRETKISIIVPVFNGEKYIEECLESLVQQTYNNIEVIVINDGSTDGTEKIVRKMMRLFPSIRLLSTSNKGVSNARNKGIDLAEGEYLMFVDADDTLIKDAVEIMVNAKDEKEYDIIVSGRLDMPECEKEGLELTGEDFFCEMLYEQKFFSVCWGKLMKSSLIKQLHFDTSYRIGEDLEMFSRMDYTGIRVFYIPKNIYKYRDNSESVTKKTYNSDWEKEIKLCRNIVEHNKGKVREAAVARYIRINASCISYAVRGKCFDKISVLQRNIKKFLGQYMSNGKVPVKLKLKVVIKAFLPICIRNR